LGSETGLIHFASRLRTRLGGQIPLRRCGLGPSTRLRRVGRLSEALGRQLALGSRIGFLRGTLSRPHASSASSVHSIADGYVRVLLGTWRDLAAGDTSYASQRVTRQATPARPWPSVYDDGSGQRSPRALARSHRVQLAAGRPAGRELTRGRADAQGHGRNARDAVPFEPYGDSAQERGRGRRAPGAS